MMARHGWKQCAPRKLTTSTPPRRRRKVQLSSLTGPENFRSWGLSVMSIMDRPARIQRKSGPVGPQRGGTAPEINIWTGKKKMSREELASKVCSRGLLQSQDAC